MNSRMKEVKNTKDVDILILGSSHAYRDVDIRIIKNQGYSIFNLGSSSQSPVQTAVLVDRYLKQLNPKLIVYDTYPGTFSLDGVESSLDVIANDRNDFKSIKMALIINNITVYNTLIYGLMRDAFDLNSSFDEPTRRGLDQYIPGGYVERELRYYKHVNYTSRNWYIRNYQKRAFERIISMFSRHNIDYILVNAPITSSYYNAHANNSYVDSMLSSYGEYYDFNQSLHLDDSLYFFDNNHLNQKGVELYTEKLIETIEGRKRNTRSDKK